MDLSGTWRAASPTTTCAAPPSPWTSTTTAGSPSTVPGHWRSHAGLRRQRRPAALPHPLRARRRRRRAPALGRARRRLLPGRRLARRRLPRRPEGYFFPHAFEITDLARLGTEHVLAVEVTCAPPADRHDEAQPSPASSSTRTASTRPGTRAASGGRCASSAPARSASAACACCAARPTPSGRSCQRAGRLDSDEARTVARPHDRRRPASSASSSSPAGRAAATRSSGASASTARRCGGRGRSATSRCRRVDGRRCYVDHEIEPTPAPSAPASARWRCATGCCR